MLRQKRSIIVAPEKRLRPAPFMVPAPRPGIPNPKRRQHSAARRLRPADARRDADQHIVRRSLGVLHEQIEVTARIEDSRIQQLELGIGFSTAPILLAQLGIGERRLWILVEGFHEGVRGRGIEIEVALLHVLAMIALGAGQTEEALLEDRIAAVPQSQSKAQPTLAVADAEQTVFAPAIGTTAGLVM